MTETEAQKIEHGDIVTLKSGGPEMTVNAIENMNCGIELTCVWFAIQSGEWVLNTEKFFADCLIAKIQDTSK